MSIGPIAEFGLVIGPLPPLDRFVIAAVPGISHAKTSVNGRAMSG
jgi:hypothetical protein